ncbi:hypothetical protein GTY65_36455 [Streptomyces sp. SID8379]|uniref:hypothetical protein n=1 Tax=unclassified Streptomyces TaxID=2593676 RepID=UPI00036938C9|nr:MULTISPECIES: hypothetical protein [unclassified Streptomyces]MYW69520.1 hypothetical protein [Streptomyces sp. SID8379]
MTAAFGALAVISLGLMVFGIVQAVGDDPLPVAGKGGQATAITADEMSGLLKKHSQALTGGDKDGYLAPFEGGSATLRTKQASLFANLRKVPFEVSEYQYLSIEGRAVDHYGAGASASVDVAFVHQVKGADASPVAEWYRWTVEKKSEDAELKVTAVGPATPELPGYGDTINYPAPWDAYESMAVTAKAHTVIMSDAAQAADARRYAPYIEKAAKDNLAIWAAKGPKSGHTMPGFVVTLEKNRKVYKHMFREGTADEGDESISEAGVSIQMPAVPAGGTKAKVDVRNGGARIVMDTSESRFSRPDYAASVLDISHHELAHTMVEPLTGRDSQPQLWVMEGFADYMAKRNDAGLAANDVRALKAYYAGSYVDPFDGKLPLSDDFHSTDDAENSAHYSLGWLAIRFIAEKYGEDKALAFVAEQYQNSKGMDAQLTKATGMGLDEFQAAWADYVRKQIS